jgi:hypothetical protein
MKQVVLSLMLVNLIISSSAYAQLSPKNGGHCFTLDIPEYMVKTYELNDVATLQYMNAGKEAYVVVIEDSKDQLESLGIKYVGAKDFLEGFLKDYNKDASERKVGKIVEFSSNNNKIAQAEFTWKDEKLSYYMITTAVESKGYFYKILTWTITENKDALKNDFLAIAKSLKD